MLRDYRCDTVRMHPPVIQNGNDTSRGWNATLTPELRMLAQVLRRHQERRQSAN